jgi:hypothetical protein
MNPITTIAAERSPLFCAPLPRGVREDAEALSWDAFTARYSPSGGPLRLGAWESEQTGRSSARLGPQACTFRATLALGDRIDTATVEASGPLAALTAMLHERGIGVELTSFHQLRSGSAVATFVRGSDGRAHQWAMGWAEDATQSALRALIACANRLLSTAETDDLARKTE